MAILRCTEILLTKKLMRWRINICSVRRASLTAPTKTTTKSSLLWECIQVLGTLIELNKVTLLCIPEHQGMPGNEEADRLTKEGVIEVPPNQFSAITFTAVKKLIKIHLELKHKARWAACTGCRQSKMLDVTPSAW
jgi:hypothetical protein